MKRLFLSVAFLILLAPRAHAALVGPVAGGGGSSSVTPASGIVISGSPAENDFLGYSSASTFKWMSPAYDGWISDTVNTWTGLGTSSFTISADVTARLYTGDPIKWTQSATVKYAHVLSVAYTSVVSTITIVVNSSHTLAAGDMTSPYYSHDANPGGFPEGLHYTATYTGFSAAPAAGGTKYRMKGKHIWVTLHPSAAGTSNATNFLVSLPATSASNPFNDGNGVGFYVGDCGVVDNGTASATRGRWDVVASTTTARILRDFGGAAWTGSGSKNAVCHEIHYEVP